MTVACPSCYSSMFAGSKYCQTCGTTAVQPQILSDEYVGDCPQCKSPLDLLHVGDSYLWRCNKGDGIWMDQQTFESVCTNNEKQIAVLNWTSECSVSPEKVEQKPRAYRPCPICCELMNQKIFAKSSDVVIDHCRGHGFWFDANELPQIISFVSTGGLQRAQQHELRELERKLKESRADRQLYTSEGSTELPALNIGYHVLGYLQSLLK